MLIKNLLLLLLIFAIKNIVLSQDDLLGQLDSIQKESTLKESKKKEILRTFNSNRIVCLQTIETLSKKSLLFQIQHRFGSFSSGFSQFFGLDEANVRFSLSYGLTDDIMLEIGRDKYNATYDAIVKYRFLKQKKKGFPFSAAVLATTAIESRNSAQLDENFSRRISYTFQVILAKKFGNWFSFQVSPTIVHRNYVLAADINNTLFALGVGGRLKVSSNMHLIADYVLPLSQDQKGLKNPLGIGMEFVSGGGGHIFQIHFSNASAMHENGFIRGTYKDFFSSDLHFGFNLTRIWSF